MAKPTETGTRDAEDLAAIPLADEQIVEPPRTTGGRRRPGAAIGALAVGALATGAMAIGALAIGRLAVGRARLGRVEIDELIIRRLTIMPEPTDEA